MSNIETLSCSNCLQRVSPRHFYSGYCRECNRVASRHRMRKMRARRKKTHVESLWCTLDSDKKLPAKEIERAARGLLSAFGGISGLASAAAEMLNNKSLSPTLRFKLIRTTLSLIQSADRSQQSQGADGF
ncbi:hypothetical protein AB1L42_22980 [Thalassoglobus sp. JC818]|uniref:hypothetical protein n=1 Tax=Thalassoglobus sp. JC818 TaxID=3232136 RepID=UPI0034592883